MWFLRRHPYPFLRLAREYGDLVSFRIGAREVVLVSEPRLIDQIFRDYYSHFEKDWGPRRGASAFRNGLLTSEGNEHRAQRQTMSAMFTRAAIEAKRPLIASIVEEWTARQRDGAAIDVFQEMSHLGAAIAGRVLFGVDLDPARMIEAGEPLRRSFRRVMFPYADRLRVRRDRGKNVQALVGEIRARGQSGEGLLAPLVRDGTDDQLATMLITGQETVRIATSWAWFLLSAHPGARERLARESEFAKPVLMESLRLYPPQWMIGRRAIEPYRLDESTVPAGALVLLSPYIVQRDPRFFDQPEDFVPERWLRGDPPARGTFFPFGGGPRRCIGDVFAIVAATTILSVIARRWRLECDPRGGRLNVRLTLQPRAMPARLRAVLPVSAAGGSPLATATRR